MKWIENNLIGLIAVLTTLVQAWSIHQKNIKDAKNKEAELALKQKQLDVEATISKQKLEAEVNKFKSTNQTELDKISLSNEQQGYNKTFQRAQEVFEQYITETRNILNTTTLPCTFPKSYYDLESLVLLYCPEAMEDINDFNSFNVPYADAHSDLSQEKYIEHVSTNMKIAFDDIIHDLSVKIVHQSKTSK